MHYTLILGNKVYSSWSLRGWLLFEAFGIPFTHSVIPLHTKAFADFAKSEFPAKQVPTLHVGRGSQKFTIWDSLSITEFLHENHPEAGLWPHDDIARAAARSLCAEMHASFTSLRATMPMNLRRRYSSFVPDAETVSDIGRICALWAWAKENWGDGGSYLFGDRFCAADAFFAPVASRLRTYGISIDALSEAYISALLSHPATEAFFQDAKAETWVMDHNELDID
jgi:glutathione S-transferase